MAAVFSLGIPVFDKLPKSIIQLTHGQITNNESIFDLRPAKICTMVRFIYSSVANNTDDRKGHIVN